MTFDAGMVLESSNFDQAMMDLSHLTGKSFSKVIKSEASSILGQAMKNTGSASASSITAHYTYRDPGLNEKTIPTIRLNGRSVRVRSIKKKGVLEDGKWNPRKTNPLWKPLQTELKRLMKIAKSRRGLSKATWLLIAAQIPLGPPKNVPGYVRNTNMGGSIRRAVKGKEVGTDKYHILIHNASYTALAPAGKGGPGGYAAFSKAMSGRFLYFERNVTEGVFDKVGDVVKKYPGFMMETS
jgi:hypothetical protein